MGEGSDLGVVVLVEMVLTLVSDQLTEAIGGFYSVAYSLATVTTTVTVAGKCPEQCPF